MANEGSEHIVRLAGELDLAARVECFNACVNGDSKRVDVDISMITFMDCSGYGALVAARLELERRAGSLSVTHATGQPAQLVGWFAERESRPKRRSRV